MAVADTTIELAPSFSYWNMVWTRFRRHKLAMFGSIVVIVMILLCFVGAPIYSAITGMTISTQELTNRYAYPSAQHLFGTDDLGRDVLIRILYGGQVSIEVGLISALASVVLGALVGVVSGYFGGWVDEALMRFTDVMLSLPYIPLYLVLSMAFGPGFWTLIFIFVAFGWMGDARMVRGVVLSLKNMEFVEAARAVGSSNWRIMVTHLLLNSMAVIIVSTTLAIGGNIVSEAALSYLGFGIQPPMPSWGNILQTASEYIFAPRNGPWLIFYPGFFIFLTVLSFNFMGDGLRDALDPRLKNAN
ncbi:MAG: ABC transporter permease [Deltaproteobacteria bacterium]|nr:ABC transporter permease [Deltaproteobacteria bacterium]